VEHKDLLVNPIPGPVLQIIWTLISSQVFDQFIYIL
jgi:hypothetical protein